MAAPPNNEGSLQGAAEAATPVSHGQSEGTWRDSCDACKGQREVTSWGAIALVTNHIVGCQILTASEGTRPS